DTRGVLLGFENVEGEEYLARVMGELSQHPSCRFVWDTGHELCYNGAKDMMALYGDRLAGTHLNDNMGVTGSEITWHDDSHMLPFDGIADWPDIARRLHEHRFEGPLTFELISYNRPGRHTHDAYAGWDAAEFLRQAHARAERFAALI
ncbi:MAG: TIM barrel protein, partial [Eubacteriales bacterium]|nr:TIM barrel protein [Eubacteriales bacterium]